jgi:RNA polymerase sigma-70 factor (ECF subfamily)
VNDTHSWSYEVAGPAPARATGWGGARMDEEALIRAAQAGDGEAFERLVRIYDGHVLRLAMNLLRSEQDAYDVYQEAFLRVYRNLSSFRFDCSFQTWLYRIVNNLCIDHLRRQRVRRTEPARIETGEGSLDRLASYPDPRAATDPERALLSAEVKQEVRRVLDQLTPRERVVFELRHFQGMRLKEIGAALGSTEEAAKNCLFRATRKLRAGLGGLL